MKLLGAENIGGRVEKTWLTTDDNGNDTFTVQTVQDVEPVFAHVKQQAENRGRDIRYKGSVPATLIEEFAKVNAAWWGTTKQEAFAEIVGNKTDRAKRVWKLILESGDYRKLQANGA